MLMQAVALLVSRPQSRSRFDIPVHTDIHRYCTEFIVVSRSRVQVVYQTYFGNADTKFH